MPMRKYQQPRLSLTLKMLMSSGCALILIFFLAPIAIFAQAHHSQNASIANDGPTFRVNAGFDSRYRQGNWIPIQVSLRNSGADFNGTVAVNVPMPYAGSVNATPLSTYQTAISLASGAQKQVTLYVPFNSGMQGSIQNLNVNLLDADGHQVSSQVSTLRALGPTDIFVGILSDQSTGFGPLTALQLPDQTASLITEPLDASSMPSIADALNNFDLLIIDNFTTSSLNQDQLKALQNWVNQGGNLIVAGGPEWHNTLSPLPASLLPAIPSNTSTLAAGTTLLPFSGRTPTSGKQANDSINAPTVVSTATLAPGSQTILSSGPIPLIVQSQQGQGTVYYLAFDPTLDPIVTWSNATTLWQNLLLRALGDQVLVSSPSTTTMGNSTFTSTANYGMRSVLQSLFPTSFLATWVILVILVGYLLVLGPLRLIIVRRLKNRDWSWRIVLSTIMVFSLLSYGLALQQKGTSVLSSSISVLRLDQSTGNFTTAHTTTYVGVFVPNQGDFQVHMPGFSLVQPSNDQLRFQSQPQSQPTTITSTSNSVDVNLRGVNIWTLRTLSSQHDSQLPGSITPNLTIHNTALTGTVTNTLPYSLSDAYLLINGHYQSLGYLASGKTASVNLSLKDNPNGPQGTSFADQIASSKGLPIPYASYYNSQQKQNDFQRHMAMLAALSGESSYDCGSYPCAMHISGGGGVTSTGLVINGNGSYNLAAYNQILNGYDPMLIPGSPATLIGWADRPNDTSSDVTINGSYTSKVQEALVEAPLNVHFVDPLNLSSNFITSQLIDVDSRATDVQTLYPGVYAVASGSMTFEFMLPSISNLHAQALIVSTPTSLPQVGNATGQNTLDANHLKVSLYNWSTHTWDDYAFNVFTFSTTNAQRYIGPGGRVLLRCANPDSIEGTAIFGRPSLQLQDSGPN
jgi:uncharacterized membrane protein YhaH (DUF805 family)